MEPVSLVIGNPLVTTLIWNSSGSSARHSSGIRCWSVNCWQVHLDCWRGKVREASIHLSTVCESRSSGNEVICRTHSTHTYYTSFTNPVHWSILRQGASYRFSLHCILLFCFVLCIVSAVDYSVWHSEAHYGIQCVNASQPVRGTMDSRQPPNSDRQTPQLCSINCNELFRNAYTALLHIRVSCTKWEKIQRRRKHKTDQRPVDGRAIMPTALLASFYFQKYSPKIVIMMKNPYLFKSWHFYLHRPPSTHGEDPFYAFSNCLKLQVW